MAICAAALGNASGEAGASSAGLDADRLRVPEQSLELFVSRHPEVYGHANLRAQGYAASPLKLWVYEDLQGEPCSLTVAEREPGTQMVITGLPVGFSFRVTRSLEVKKPGEHTYCAYMGPDQGTAENRSFRSRKVRLPLLEAGRARRTVATSLRRHEFSDKVVENLERHCDRRSRSEFSCKFSSTFPGYSLHGHGPIELKKHISYRFRVRAQGRKFTLTDENEGHSPG